MRWYEIAGGINIGISNEEQKIVDKISRNNYIFTEDLDDRECKIAKNLVHKGVLVRQTKEGRRVYVANELENF